jgi:hypothetical protein
MTKIEWDVKRTRSGTGVPPVHYRMDDKTRAAVSAQSLLPLPATKDWGEGKFQ